jgi:hypothetical protein
MDEHGGHEDLRGLGRRSVTPYVHERTKLYCSSLSCMSLLICLSLEKRLLPESFIAQVQTVTLRRDPGSDRWSRGG